ncbi:zinc finger domain-containing protein [Streptomyces microflavus]
MLLSELLTLTDSAAEVRSDVRASGGRPAELISQKRSFARARSNRGVRRPRIPGSGRRSRSHSRRAGVGFCDLRCAKIRCVTDPQESSLPAGSEADLVERHPCPKCKAAPGSPCRSRSGAVASAYHTGRFTKVPKLAKELRV